MSFELTLIMLDSWKKWSKYFNVGLKKHKSFFSILLPKFGVVYQMMNVSIVEDRVLRIRVDSPV
jgi:hypothetical protein